MMMKGSFTTQEAALASENNLVDLSKLAVATGQELADDAGPDETAT